jgi:hypothetical protein
MERCYFRISESEGRNGRNHDSTVRDSEGEAENYLQDLLARPEYRSMDEVQIRPQEYIKAEELKTFFLKGLPKF